MSSTNPINTTADSRPRRPEVEEETRDAAPGVRRIGSSAESTKSVASEEGSSATLTRDDHNSSGFPVSGGIRDRQESQVSASPSVQSASTAAGHYQEPSGSLRKHSLAVAPRSDSAILVADSRGEGEEKAEYDNHVSISNRRPSSLRTTRPMRKVPGRSVSSDAAVRFSVAAAAAAEDPAAADPSQQTTTAVGSRARVISTDTTSATSNEDSNSSPRPPASTSTHGSSRSSGRQHATSGNRSSGVFQSRFYQVVAQRAVAWFSKSSETLGGGRRNSSGRVSEPAALIHLRESQKLNGITTLAPYPRTSMGSLSNAPVAVAAVVEEEEIPLSQQPFYRSVTVLADTIDNSNESLGLEFERDEEDGSLLIKDISRGEECLFSKTPLRVGDRMVSVNNSRCHTWKPEEALQRIKPLHDRIVIVVENHDGDPNLVQAMVTKPNPNCAIGITLKRRNRSLKVTEISPDGLFAQSVLNTSDKVLYINGTPSETMEGSVAAAIVRSLPREVTITARHSVETAMVVSRLSGRRGRRSDAGIPTATATARVGPYGSTEEPESQTTGRAKPCLIFVFLIIAIIIIINVFRGSATGTGTNGN